MEGKEIVVAHLFLDIFSFLCWVFDGGAGYLYIGMETSVNLHERKGFSVLLQGNK